MRAKAIATITTVLAMALIGTSVLPTTAGIQPMTAVKVGPSNMTYTPTWNQSKVGCAYVNATEHPLGFNGLQVTMYAIAHTYTCTLPSNTTSVNMSDTMLLSQSLPISSYSYRTVKVVALLEPTTQAAITYSNSACTPTSNQSGNCSIYVATHIGGVLKVIDTTTHKTYTKIWTGYGQMNANNTTCIKNVCASSVSTNTTGIYTFNMTTFTFRITSSLSDSYMFEFSIVATGYIHIQTQNAKLTGVVASLYNYAGMTADRIKLKSISLV